MTEIHLNIKNIASMLALSTLLFYSCSKKELDTATDGEKISLSISVEGITEEEPATPADRSMSVSPRTANGETIVEQRTTQWGDIGIDITAAEGRDRSFGGQQPTTSFEKVKQKMISRQQAVAAINPLAANIPMDAGIKYWFILYNKSSQKYEYSKQITSLLKSTFDIVKNQEYEWYAFSYNDGANITAPDLNTMRIQTRTDKPFLYATGTFKATAAGNTNIPITFAHQLQQVNINLDTRGLFGNINNATLKAKFTADSYIKTRAFNLNTGILTGTQTNATVTDLTFTAIEDDSQRQMHAIYYTSDFTQKSYTVQASNITVTFPNGNTENVTISPRQETFTFTLGGKGRVHHAKLALWRSIPRKSVLHFEGNENYSYSASNPNKASGAFLRSATNFGTNSKYMKVNQFTHEVTNSLRGKIAEKLANPANYPDIVIAGITFSALTDDFDALYKYLSRGGVVFLMVSQDNNGGAQNFFRKVFGHNGISATPESAANGGTVYKLEEVDSDVLAWPFADARGQYWGKDTNPTLMIGGLTSADLDKIVVYSRSSANVNKPYPVNSVSMFRHKTLNLFFVGDTGFLGNELRNGIYTNQVYHPFATNSSDFPIPRTNYGSAAARNSPEYPTVAGSWSAYNSAIFGNIFSLIISQAHYIPLDKSP